MASYNKYGYNYLPENKWESQNGFNSYFTPLDIIINQYKTHLFSFGVVFFGSWLLSPYIVPYLPGNSPNIAYSFLPGTYAVFSSMLMGFLYFDNLNHHL